MKKAVIITAVITVVSLLCAIGFGIAAAASGIPVAIAQINRFWDFDLHSVYQADELVDRVIGTIDDFTDDFGDATAPLDRNTTATLDMSNATRVSIQVDAAQVNILPGDGETATVEVETTSAPSRRTLNAIVSGDTAIIESRIAKRSITLSEIVRTKVTVRLPQKTYETVCVEMDAGDLSTENVDCRSLTLSLDAGNAVVKNTTAEDMTVSCNAGNINLQNAALTALSVDVDAGNITLKDVTGETLDATANAGMVSMSGDSLFTKAIDAKVDMGNIELLLSKDLGFTLDYDAQMGNFLNRFDGKTTISSHRGELVSQKGSLSYLDGACTISLKINMGNITIN